MSDRAEDALRRLTGRVSCTLDRVGDRFPLYADPTNGCWTSSRRGSWTGGFWAGLLAIRAHVLGGQDPVSSALRVRERLAGWVETDTVCRGMIFWYGETATWSGLAPPSPAAADATRSLVAAFDPAIGAIPWGGGLGSNVDPRSVAPDGAVGVVPLLSWHGPGARVLAGRHLGTHLRLDTPAWSRGRAWLMLAAADAQLHRTPLPAAASTPSAATLAQQWLARFGTAVPPAHVPAGAAASAVLDSSAAAIAAVALLTLATGHDDRRWWAAGARLLTTLIDEQPRSGPSAGGLTAGCYDLHTGLATRHELIWGDYFFALGLAILTGLIDPARIPVTPRC